MSAILLSVKRLANYEVYDRQGDKLGVLDDLMLDDDCAKVRYAVLACKSFGHSKKLFAVPLAALRLDTENECFMLDVDRETLSQSPGFDSDSPPAAPDPSLVRRPSASSNLVSGSRRA
jgi:sporulation protein YlmC with PRC-barrel domain